MSSNQFWKANQMPDLSGKIAVVTGANSGLGYEVVRGLARKNAQVIMACRDAGKAEKAAARIRDELPNAKIELMTLDLADLSSVRGFAQNFADQFSQLDILCNNAGVMALPYRQTKENFEMQFGTNHLGHFALTGLLLPSILKAEKARIVTTSSVAHRFGKVDFADLQSKRSYNSWGAYGQSKLANLLFAYELQRKLSAASVSNVVSVAAHPGYSSTNLQMVGPSMQGSIIGTRVSAIGNSLFAQSAEMGALPTLYAATAPNVQGGDFIGPGGLMEMYGYPVKVRSNARSYDQNAARQLWQVSEELTGVGYDSLKQLVK